MKKIILSGVFAIAICLVGGTGCSRKVDEQLVSISEQISAVESVKSELKVLNLTYMESATKGAHWWRYLIFAVADVAGYALGGGVTGGVSASTLAWSVTADLDSGSGSGSNSGSGSGSNSGSAPGSGSGPIYDYTPPLEKVPDYRVFVKIFKNDYLGNLEPGSVGYIHNSVIANTYEQHEDLYSKSYEEILRLTLEELENQTGEMLSVAEKTEIINSTISLFSSFDAGKSVEEYIDELIEQTSDTTTREALELCGLVLQGLQYVDDYDTTYIEKATSIISDSDLDSELKSTVLDGMSVAYASAKLWNTDSL